MTLNLVLKAKADNATDGKGAALTCAAIARRWLDSADWSLTGAALAEKLTAKDGPLALIGPENIERIETNIQIAHVTPSPAHEFRTDYLLKVFDYNPQSKTFEEATLEDQIDRERLLSDEKLGRDFKAWLLDPVHLERIRSRHGFDPEGVSRHPRDCADADRLFRLGVATGFRPRAGRGRTARSSPRSDVVTALQKAAERGISLQNIRSVAGFERRLNDITCAGCHQTRGIGGFHFPGVDWMAANPSNTTIVPASPHFFGDQVRRRDILTEIRDGKQVGLSPRLFRTAAIARQPRTRRHRI